MVRLNRSPNYNRYGTPYLPPDERILAEGRTALNGQGNEPFK
jgi:hypothetical protein